MTDRSNRAITRREFASTAAMAAVAAAIAPRQAFAGQSPSGKLNIAAIGVGGMGAANLKACEGENIVALCDVDSDYAAKTFALYPKATVYTDYRVMLEKQKDIDAVVIATPDHTHATITMACLQARQTRVLPEAADAHRGRGARDRRGGSEVQGRHADGQPGPLLRVDAPAEGMAGRWRHRQRDEVHAWTDRPVGGDPWSDFAVRARPTDTPPVPATLDWDKWLGPAAFRPYSPEYLPMKWRAWLDFGTGPLGDMGCHILDPAFWALELGPPQTIEATSTHYEPNVASETYPRASIVRYTFPARGSRPPVKLTWYDGRLLPPIPPELEPGRTLPGSGALLIGDKGTILHGSHGADGVRLIPETRMQEYTRPPKTLRRVTEGHEGDWIRACKEGPGGVPPCSPFEYGAALTEMVLLGVLAIRMKDQRLEWDRQSSGSRTTIRRTVCSGFRYREGWTL